MRLTDEKITDIKEYLDRSIKVSASSLIPQLSKYGIDLIDTIEALQQEIEQLKDENASLRNWNACEEELHNELLESDKRRWELELELEDANNYRAGLEAIVDKLRAHVMRMSEILDDRREGRMSNTYFKAMSVMGCEIGGITRRSLCRHNCCDGENCVTWLEKQFAKLNEYEEAKADGRLVVLPCKTEDTVFIVYAKKILETTVDKRAWTDDDGYMLRTKEEWFKEKDIGKTVFLTREAAEKAIGGGKK